MNINNFIIFIFIILVCFKSTLVKSQDDACIQNLVNRLFNYQSTVDVCTDNNGFTSPDGTWSYISICNSNNIPELFTLISKTLNSNYLGFSDLSCFTSLTNISLTNITFEQDAFGTGSQGIAQDVLLYTCSFKDQLISTSSISSGISYFYMKINDQLNLPQIAFSAIKTLNSFELVHDISVTVQNYVTFINDLSPGDTDFNVLTLTSNQIPSFNNIKVSDLYFNLVQGESVTSFDSLGTLSQVIGLYLAFNFDSNSQIDYPNSLSLSTNLEELTFTGQFNTPTTSLSLPPNLKKLTIADSPFFNENGEFPFILPSTLTTITISDLGLINLPQFPSNIESIYFENNINLNNILPDLSSYSKLVKVSLINCGFYGSIPNSYCNFNKLDLSNNNLKSSVPQCLVCYKNEDYNDFNFNNNPSLNIDSCSKGSIIPNLYYDDSTKKLDLSGQNLGTKGPLILNTNLEFQVVELQKFFSLVWDDITYGPITDTIQMKFGDNTFTLATKVLNPVITSITKFGELYTFSGSNLSYNQSDIQLLVSNIPCSVVSIDFNSIQCNFKKKLPIGQDISATIQNVKLSTSLSEIIHFTVNTAIDKTTILKTCSSNCNIDLGQGKCSSTSGLCLCTTFYYGDSCSIPSPFLSSVSSVYKEGGLVNLYGWFSNSTTNDMSIKIGESLCKVNYVDQYFSNCTLGPGNGTVSVILEFENFGGYTWIGNNIFHYTEPFYKCPNNCSSHGKCDTLIGQCHCNLGYGGYSCNSKISIDSSTSSTSNEFPNIPRSNTTINETFGTAVINNQDTSFEISVISLVELDINNNIVNLFNLTNNWNITTTSSSSSSNSTGNTYTFQQEIQESCIITYDIQEINEPQVLYYAGLNITLEKNSIKMSVLIQNYSFSSALNQLQLRLQSSVENNDNSDGSLDDNNECNNKESEINTNLIDKNQLLNYVLVSKNNKILNAVFINRVESDNRNSFITNSIISNQTRVGNKDIIVIGLNLPHCAHECFIDPHFQVVLDELFKDNCVNGRPSWVLLVSIVVPCGFFVIAVIICSIIFKQHRTFWLIKVYNLKEFIKNLTRSSKEYIYMPNRNSF